MSLSNEKSNKVLLGLVMENNQHYINHVTLILSSLRRNGGLLKDAPVLVVVNGRRPLPQTCIDKWDRLFGEIHYEVREPETIHGVGPIAKLSVLLSPMLEHYDTLIFMDCDTLVANSLDELAVPLDCDLMVRKGGFHDCEAFLDYGAIAEEFNMKERPMFNSGVVVLRTAIAEKLYSEVMRIAKWLFANHSKKYVSSCWFIEQCAMAIAADTLDLKWKYLDSKFNACYNAEPIHILHIFRSVFRLPRSSMLGASYPHAVKKFINRSEVHYRIFGKELKACMETLNTYKP